MSSPWPIILAIVWAALVSIGFGTLLWLSLASPRRRSMRKNGKIKELREALIAAYRYVSRAASKEHGARLVLEQMDNALSDEN